MSAKCICLGTLGGVHTIPLTAYIQETVGPEKEERKMIRQFQTSDTKQVMQLWFTGNENAHPFISRDYWRSHFAEVQEQLLQAEVFVYDKDGKIQGFIGMINEYIAGIFVEKNCRSCGIGKQLLDYANERYDTLSLGV